MCTSFFTISNGNYCGIVDENQKEILPCIFTFVSIFTGTSLFCVRKTNSLKFGLYNFEGKEVLPCDYDTISLENKSGNQYIQIRQGHCFGILDINGKVILPCKYALHYRMWDRDFLDYVKISKNGKYGLFSFSEKRETIPCIYDSLEERPHYTSLSDIFHGIPSLMAICKRGNTFDIWDNRWTLCDSFEEFSMEDFNGCARVKNDGKFGLIDKDFNMALPFEYDELYVMNNNYIWAKKNGKVGIFDTALQIAIPFKYEGDYERGTFDKADFREGLVPLMKNGKYGYVSETGVEVIDFIYSSAGNFWMNTANVVLNGISGTIDKMGRFKKKRVRFLDDSDYQQQLHDELVQDGLRDAFGLSSEDEVPNDWSD